MNQSLWLETYPKHKFINDGETKEQKIYFKITLFSSN